MMIKLYNTLPDSNGKDLYSLIDYGLFRRVFMFTMSSISRISENVIKDIKTDIQNKYQDQIKSKLLHILAEAIRLNKTVTTLNRAEREIEILIVDFMEDIRIDAIKYETQSNILDVMLKSIKKATQ